LELDDQIPHGRVELTDHTHHFFGLGCDAEGSPSPQVREQDRDLTPMALQDAFTLRENKISERRREEAPEPREPLKLLNLLGHPRFEVYVQVRELCRLCLDHVVVVLDPDQRLDSNEELLLVEWLGYEVVGARLDGGEP